MKKILSALFCMLSLFVVPLSGQIITQNVSRTVDIYPGIKSIRNTQINSFHMKNVDVSIELKKDSVEISQGFPPRFGKDFDVDIDLIKQATSLSENDSLFYIYQIFSQGAQS